MLLMRAVPFKSSIGDDLMEKTLSTLLKQHKEESTEKDSQGRKSVFADTVKNDNKHPINLDVITFKVPLAIPILANRPVHPKINRFSLPHSLSDGRTSVLLVTKDIKKQTTALTNAHYLEMLTNANCNHLVTEILSVKQLKDEYTEIEARLDLCARTDLVLCEKAVVNIVPRLLGRPFLTAKKHPMAVNLKQTNLKKHLTEMLSLTSHKMAFRNTQSSLTLGCGRHTAEQLKENLAASLEYLCSDMFPGGWSNVKTLYLTLGLKTRVPLYISTGLSSDVPDLKVRKAKPEVLEGDFGFGPVKITDSGNILEYKPLEDDEDGQMVEKLKLLKKTYRTGDHPASKMKRMEIMRAARRAKNVKRNTKKAEKKKEAKKQRAEARNSTGEKKESVKTLTKNKANGEKKMKTTVDMKKLKKASRIHSTLVQKDI